MGQFGDKFRKAREKKGISLDDASNVTKIGSRMLLAIEEEHFDLLPGGVFNKGFIRAYAKHLGINDQEAVSEYLDCLRQEQVKAQALWQPQARPSGPEKPSAGSANAGSAKAPAVQYKDQASEDLPGLQLPKAEHVRPAHQKYLGKRDSAIPWRLIVATVVVLFLAVVLWRRHAIGNAASPVAVMATQPAAGAALTPATTTSGAPSAAQGGKSNATPPTGGSSMQAGGGAATSAPKAAPDEGDNEVTTRTVGGATSAPTEKPAATLTLVIRATENSWVSVSADGQSVSSENLIAPAHTSVRASREIVARVGNAAGVTFLWNGKEIPAQGAEAEVKTFVFDAQGMRVVAAGQPATQTP